MWYHSIVVVIGAGIVQLAINDAMILLCPLYTTVPTPDVFFNWDLVQRPLPYYSCFISLKCTAKLQIISRKCTFVKGAFYQFFILFFNFLGLWCPNHLTYTNSWGINGKITSIIHVVHLAPILFCWKCAPGKAILTLAKVASSYPLSKCSFLFFYPDNNGVLVRTDYVSD